MAEGESAPGQDHHQGGREDGGHDALHPHGDRQHPRHPDGRRPDRHQQQVQLPAHHPALPPQLQQPHPHGQHPLPPRHHPSRLQHQAGNETL